MLNALTIDVEDYFQVHAFSSVIQYDDWPKYESRIERNIERLLEILASTVAPQPCSTARSQHHSTATPQHHNTDILASNLKRSDPQSSGTVCQGTKATFFTLGWIAERYPRLVKEISKQGHEIACHGFAHQLVYRQSREEFRNDVRKAKVLLENVTGGAVIGYRAPMYSITEKSQWAFNILIEEGFEYDSSIFPVRHDFYGMPNAPRFPFIVFPNGNGHVDFLLLPHPMHKGLVRSENPGSQMNLSNPANPMNLRTAALQYRSSSKQLIEFPVSTLRLNHFNVPISGGGYFRLLPYSITRNSLKKINEREMRSFVFYLHPWEIDPDQPRVKNVPLRSKLRHYVNLGKTQMRFQHLLKDFEFSSIRDLLNLIG